MQERALKIFLFACLISSPMPAASQVMTYVYNWTGGGDGFSWADADNWDSEDDFNDYPRFRPDVAKIGTISPNNTVYLDESVTLYNTIVSNGALLANGFTSFYPIVTANLFVTDSNASGTAPRPSLMIVGDSPAAVDLRVDGYAATGEHSSVFQIRNSTFRLEGATLQLNVAVEMLDGGVFEGWGTVDMERGDIDIFDGVLRVPDNRTLTFTGERGSFSFHDSVVAVGRDATLNFDYMLHSATYEIFRGDFLIDSSATMHVGLPWVGKVDTYNSARLKFIDTGASFSGNTISGEPFSTEGEVDLTEGDAGFTAEWTADRGQVNVGSSTRRSALVVTDGLIEPDTDVAFTQASFSVNGDFQVDQTGKVFDWDGPDNDNRTSVNGSLQVRANAINPSGTGSPDRYAGSLQVAGQLDVQTDGGVFEIGKIDSSNPARFTFLELSAELVPRYSGDPIRFDASADLFAESPIADGQGVAHFDAPVVLDGATVELLGMKIVFNDDAVIDGGSFFGSGGALRIGMQGSAELISPLNLGSIDLENKGELTMRGGLIFGDPLFGSPTVDNYTQEPGGKLRMNFNNQFFDTIPGDRLNVSGDASLAGTLDLNTPDNFDPALGISELIIPVNGTISGNFVRVTGVGIGPGKFLAITYEADGVRMTVAIPGDNDLDGDIDDADLGTAFSNYTGPIGAFGGKTAADGDTDGDGDVDDADLGTSFSGYTGPLSPADVPEPNSLGLLAIGGSLLALRRRRAG